MPTPSPENSGNATVVYLEHDKPVGTRETYCCGYVTPGGQRHSGYWPNTAYVCPTCGQLWARAIYNFHFSYASLVPALWTTEIRNCPEHGDGFFLSGCSAEQLQHCSRELLAREVLLLFLNHKGPLP